MTCFVKYVGYYKVRLVHQIHLKKEDTAMKIEKIVKPSQQIVSINTKTPVAKLPELIGPSFMKLAAYIKQEGAEIVSMPFVSYKGMNEDGQIDGDNIDVEIGFPIDRPVKDTIEFKYYSLPSYKAVTTLFKGSYDDLTSPYLEMLAYIRQDGGKFLGTSYEYYLSDEEIESDQQETLLEIPYQ